MKEEREINIPITDASKSAQDISEPDTEARKDETPIQPTEKGDDKQPQDIIVTPGPEAKTANALNEPAEGEAKTEQELPIGDHTQKSTTELAEPGARQEKEELIEEIPSEYLWKQLRVIDIDPSTVEKEEEEIQTLDHQAKTEAVINIDGETQKTHLEITPDGDTNKTQINIADAAEGDTKEQQVINVPDTGVEKEEQPVPEPEQGDEKALSNIEESTVIGQKQHVDIEESIHQFKDEQAIVSYNWQPKDEVDIFITSDTKKEEQTIAESTHLEKTEQTIPELQHLSKSLQEVLPPGLQTDKDGKLIQWDEVVEEIKSDLATQKVIDIKQFSHDKIKELYGEMSIPELTKDNAKSEENVIKIGPRNVSADANYIRNNPANALDSIKSLSFSDIMALIVEEIAILTRNNKIEQEIAQTQFEMPAPISEEVTFGQTDKLVKVDDLSQLNASITDTIALRNTKSEEDVLIDQRIQQKIEGDSFVFDSIPEQVAADNIKPVPQNESGRVILSGITSGGGPRGAENTFGLGDAANAKPDTQAVQYIFTDLSEPLVGEIKPGSQGTSGMMTSAGLAKSDGVEPLADLGPVSEREEIEYNITRDATVHSPSITTFPQAAASGMTVDAGIVKQSPDITNLKVGEDGVGNDIITQQFDNRVDRQTADGIVVENIIPGANTFGLENVASADSATIKGTQADPRAPIDIPTDDRPEKDAQEYPFSPSEFVTPAAATSPGIMDNTKATQTKDTEDNQVTIGGLNRNYDDRKEAGGFVRTYRAEAGMGFEKKLPLDLHLSNVPGFQTVSEAAQTLGVNPSKLNSVPEALRLNLGPVQLGQELPYYDLYFTANRFSRPLGPRGAMSEWFKTAAKQAIAGAASNLADVEFGEIQPGTVPKMSDKVLDKVKPKVVKELRGYGHLEVFAKGNDDSNMSVVSGDDNIYRRSVMQNNGSPLDLKIPSRIPFQFKPEITGDSKSASWSALQILGRSNSLYAYTGSSNRSLSMNLTYAVLEPIPASNQKAIDTREFATTTISDLAKSGVNKDLAGAGLRALEGMLAKDYQGMEDLEGWDENTVYWIVNTLRGLVMPQYRRKDNTAPPVVRLHYGDYFKKRITFRNKNGELVQKPDVAPLFIITQVGVDFEGQSNPETKRHQIVRVGLSMTEVDEDIFTFEGFSDMSGYLPKEVEGEVPSWSDSIIDKLF